MSTLQSAHSHPANPRHRVATGLLTLLADAVAIGVSILFIVVMGAPRATNPPQTSSRPQLVSAPSARARCDAAQLGPQLRVAKPCYALP